MREARLVSLLLFAALSLPLVLLNATILEGSLRQVSITYAVEDMVILIDALVALISLILVLVAVLIGSPIIYGAALLVHLLRGSASVFLEPLYLLPIFLGPAVLIIGKTWRAGQIKSLRMRGSHVAAAVVSLALFLAGAIYLSLVLGEFVWKFVQNMKLYARIESPAAEPIVELLLVNPFGNLLVILIVLSMLYRLFAEIGEVLVLYIRPSRKTAIEAIKSSVDFNAPFITPLASLRNIILSLSISPPIYYIVVAALAGIELDLPYMYSLAVRLFIALAIFSTSWFMISKLMSIIQGAEPGVVPIAAGVAIIVLFYLLAYVAGLWSPEQGLSPTSADAYISKILISYYGTFLALGEAFLIVIGVAP